MRTRLSHRNADGELFPSRPLVEALFLEDGRKVVNVQAIAEASTRHRGRSGSNAAIAKIVAENRVVQYADVDNIAAGVV